MIGVEDAEAVRRAREEFGGPLPPRVEALGEGPLADLADALNAARRQQGRHLAEATEASLAQLPWPLRSVVRRVLGQR